MLAGLICAAARLLSGASVRWADGGPPDTRQRIYFANHTSHLDFVVLWSSLPREVRALTRPVAGRDYWERGAIRRYLAAHVFRAVLIDRHPAPPPVGEESPPEITRGSARHAIATMIDEMGDRYSLIVFPEGTRGTGGAIAPFKSGLYHLAKQRPNVELTPVFMANLWRILPKGETLPVPMLGRVTFGMPLNLATDEPKPEFLARARNALCALGAAS